MADLSKAERSDLRIPLYPTGTLFGDVWLSCVNDGTFVLNPQKMLKMLESRLECDNRQHPFFLDLKQALFTMWPIPEFKVQDCEYPDKIGAMYPLKSEVAMLEERRSKMFFTVCFGLIID